MYLVLGVELVGPDWRVFAGMLPMYAWAVGAIILSGMAYGVRTWKYFDLTFSVPCIILIPLIA